MFIHGGKKGGRELGVGAEKEEEPRDSQARDLLNNGGMYVSELGYSACTKNGSPRMTSGATTRAEW